jgi:hypothetical protein
MDVFLSYNSADRATAEKLAHELVRDGVSVWFDAHHQMEAADDLAGTLERELRECRNLLVLVGSRAAHSPWQQREWRKILEEIWRDPSKRLIPVLLPGASLPAFVRSTSSSGELQAVRIENPADMAGAAQAILRVMRGTEEAPEGSADPRRTRSVRDAPRGLALSPSEGVSRSVYDGSDPGDPNVKADKGISVEDSGSSTIVAVPAAADREKLAARYAEIEEFAKSLKR